MLNALLQEAVVEFRKRIAEFNACTAYTGLSAGLKIEEAVVAALLSLLPASVGLSPSGSEAIATTAVLHCLQRLASSPSGASAIISIAGDLLQPDACVLYGPVSSRRVLLLCPLLPELETG